MSSSNFQTTIQTYLENRAKTDSLFAETYRKANKSIEECIKYIYSQARKLAKGGNAVGVDDATVYGWAVHYYDEDDIKVDKVKERVEVVAPAAEPSRTEQPKPQPKPVQKRKRGEDNSLQLSLFGEL
ncbi:PcfK-like family protein [Bacteroides mediterraneensis]|uniref:PcfK-like family protein n=1 Tax=Bacteroides mediterraneensis TaxID=1841856 RepID=A0ABS2EYV4_9BACE|nr:PcfK-like family protein [Bacteroides mediterraneensis]MBM6759733.1 PcfK-like family protein [Bacteroides mediterraneensis]